MALTDRADLLFSIKADSDQAKKAFKDLKGDLKDLKSEADGSGTAFEKFASGAGLSTSSLNALSIAGSIAAAGITAMAAAAVTTATTLFKLAQSASEFGSQIFEATQKTGLSAQAISALKVAAEQSGSSLEGITGSVSKFNVLLGEANQGNEKAAATLRLYGITATDTDTALRQALTTISEMTTADQRAAAAKALFKDRTAEILPIIDSFNGDLDGLIKKMSELGLTIDDEAARAADEFGDTLDTLTAQIAGVGREFANEFVPELTRGMNRVSAEFTKNQGVAAEWGAIVADIIRGLTVAAESDFGRLVATFANGTAQILRYTLPLLQILDTLRSIGAGDRQLAGSAGGLLGPGLTGGIRIPSVGGGGGGGGRSRADTSERDAEREAERQKREADRIERERVQTARDYFENETEFFAAEAEKRLAVLRSVADAQKLSAEDVARFEEFLALDTLEFKKRKLQEYFNQLIGGTDAYKRAEQDLRVLEQGIETQRAQNAKKENDRKAKQTEDEKKRHEDRKRSWKEHIEYLIKVQELEEAEEQRRIAEEARNARLLAESQMATADGTVGGGIAGSLGVNLVSIFGPDDQMLSKAEFMKNVFADLSTSIGQSIGQMIDGFAQMVTAWVTGSDFSVKALAKMAAGVAISLAFQAGIKAIFNVAEGFARLAVGDAAGAALHFTAAKIYGTVAAVAGGAGVALGLAARSMGDGGGASAGAGSSSFARESDRPQLNNDFRSQFEGITGQRSSPFAQPLMMMKEQMDRQNVMIGSLYEVNQRLATRLDGITPDEVVRLGAPGAGDAIRQSMNNELQTDLRASEQLHRLNGAY